MCILNGRFVAPMVLLSAFGGLAQAQFIEISVESVTVTSGSTYVSLKGSAIIDTSTIPTVDEHGRYQVDAVDGRYSWIGGGGEHGPSAIDVTDSGIFENAIVSYDPESEGGFSILVSGVMGEGASPSFQLWVATGVQAFDSEDGSFSADPSAYLIDSEYEDQGMVFRFSQNQTLWTPEDHYHEGGSFYFYSVRVVEDPNQAQCSLADFNADGVLNFFDVSAFLQTFSEGCP